MNANTLAFILSDLLDKRVESLRLLHSGQIYETKLRRALDNLQTQVDPTDKDSQLERLTQRLRDTDVLHDSVGNALWYLFTACSSYPYLSEAQRITLDKMQEMFMPRRSETRSTYATQSGRAIQRRSLLNEHADTLKGFPTPDGQTLYAWVAAYIHNGEQLGQLLTQRTNLQSSQDPEDAKPQLGHTLSKTRGLLSRLRAAIQDEIDVRDELPKDLEHSIFGLFDALSTPKTTSNNPQPPQDPTPNEG